MSSNNCEKCGKELSFFTRRGGLNNERLDIHYDSLCADCFKTIKNGIASIEKMYDYMLERLSEKQVYNMASVDVDTLIYLAIETVYRLEPDFESETSALHQTIVNRSERVGNPLHEMATIVERIIDYGFAMNKKNAQIIDFKGYFIRTVLFVKPVGLNVSEAVPQSYCSAFLTCRGLVAKLLETGEVVAAPLSENQEYQYTIVNENEGTLFVFDDLFYSGKADKNVIFSTVDTNIADGIEKTIERFNVVARRRIERNKRNLQTAVTEKLFKDLKKLQPGCAKIDFPMEFIMIFLVKNIKEDVQGRNLTNKNASELALAILKESFAENLEEARLISDGAIVEFINSHSYYVDRIKATYQDHVGESVWAFFTTKGYIVNFMVSKKVMFVFDNNYPNALYYPCNDMMLKGQRFLQIPDNQTSAAEDESDFKKLDGLILYSDDIEKIQKLSSFFRFNNIKYVMDRYVEVKSEIYRNREKLIDVKRISDRLFNDFSYLPFCQYDEWAAISDKIKEDDFLLCQLIEEKTGGKNQRITGRTTYTLRIMDAFTRSAKELNACLKLNDLSIAKGILWDFFNESLVDIMTAEWIRIAGDFVKETDSLESAFAKYFNMADIETDKSYYLGLFVYYLMSKIILPFTDFLDNYERCIPVYLKYNQKVVEALAAEQADDNITEEAATDVSTEAEETEKADDSEDIEETDEAASEEETEIDSEEPETVEATETDSEDQASVLSAADEEKQEQTEETEAPEQTVEEHHAVEQIGFESLIDQTTADHEDESIKA